MYDAVVFDHDGVLVGPTDVDVLREATREAFAALGVADPDPGFVDALTHGVDPGTLEAACAAHDLDPAAFWRVRDRFSAYAQKQEILAGRKRAYDDVDALAAIAAPLGVVSSNQQDTVAFSLDRAGLRDRFRTVHGRAPTLADLRRKKPATHYLDRALRDLEADRALRDLEADRALFVGDSDADLRAAAAAGLDAAFLRRPHRADHDPAVAPTVEIDSLRALPRLPEVPADPPEPATDRAPAVIR